MEFCTETYCQYCLEPPEQIQVVEIFASQSLTYSWIQLSHSLQTLDGQH